MVYTLAELAQHVDGRVVGDEACVIDSVATLSGAQKGSISFLTNPAYKQQLTDTSASAVILGIKDVEYCHVNAIVVDDPHPAFAKIASLLHPDTPLRRGVHQSAIVAKNSQIHTSAWIDAGVIIGENVVIGENVQIKAGSVIEHDVIISDNSRILSNVTICYGTRIGKHALIHPGVVIGSDGFGQANDKGNWLKIPQLGNVIIGDDVEIGANTTIDRGAIEDTVIGDNVKLDNQIQVAHNVQIGAHTVISGCTGLAGSTRIGKHCAIGGAVTIVGHAEITDNVFITANSLVTNSIKEPGVYSSGIPIDTNKNWQKNSIRFKQLDKLAKKIKQLEKKIGLLEAKE